MSETPRTYPRRIACGDTQIEVVRMTSVDRAALVAFVADLPPHDLLFVPRDITHPKVIDAWMRALDAGDVTSLLARDGDALVGCTAIVSDRQSWSKHVGELRVLHCSTVSIDIVGPDTAPHARSAGDVLQSVVATSPGLPSRVISSSTKSMARSISCDVGGSW